MPALEVCPPEFRYPVSGPFDDETGVAEASGRGVPRPNSEHSPVAIRYPNLLHLSQIAIGPANAH